MTELFPCLRRNSLGTLTWHGLRMTEEFIAVHTMPDHPQVRPQIPNFAGKQSACNWAMASGLLPRDTKDSDIQVFER